MIAKAATTSHGANAIRYSVNKDRADIVKVNLLPDGISPEAMYARMMSVQRMFAEKINRGHPLGRNVIRIEVSPTGEESRCWTAEDWARLTDEFIRAFDSVDLSSRTGRDSSRRTNLKGSQYVVALHRDSKSGILHLHIDANRVDMDGNVNDGHDIGIRAVRAANLINAKYGWEQPEEIGARHRKEISDSCMEILRAMDRFSWRQYRAELTRRGYEVRLQEDRDGKVCGYSVMRGNSSYKSSVLGIGRNLTPSKIEDTWRRLHRSETVSARSWRDARQTPTPGPQPGGTPRPELRHYEIAIDERHSLHVAIPRAADRVIREECSLEDANPMAKIEEIRHTALLLFAGYLDAATSMSVSSGGGGSGPDDGWGRDRNEDDLEWARRCARMANMMCRRRRGLHI